ncbi:MAG: hypothetical protein Fur0018_04340 [Anaerolineales bacterium]
MNILRGVQQGLSRLRAFMFGAAISWIAPPYLLARRREEEAFFIFLMQTSLLGMPILPSRRRLILLPYVIPNILNWKRRIKLWDDSLDTVDLKHIGH